MGSKVWEGSFLADILLIRINSAHLPYLLKSPHYEITALCNSSAKSAETAVKRHGLPSSTKAYGNPEDLAKDPNVDLIICSVRVDRHHALTMPALKAGKAVFVEWPLASNLQQASEMLTAAKESGSKTIVGLQARVSPIVQKLKHLIDTKAIGELISSNIVFAVGMPGDTNPTTFAYSADKTIGGNLLTIMGGHLLDPVFYALGPVKDLSAQLQTRWPDVKLINTDGSFDRTVKRETPDHVNIHGTVGASAAPLSVSMRMGKAFPNTPTLTWHILGTKGEMRITASTMLNNALPGQKIEVFDHESGSVEVVDFESGEHVEELPIFAKNVGALYDLYANRRTREEGVVGFEEAVKLHRVIDGVEKSSEGKKWVNV
jgi:predicted dehydrogenase